MLRVLFYVVLVFLLAIGFAWLADRPGAIALTWQGYEIRTSLVVAAIALAAAIVALTCIGVVVRAVIRAPRAFESFLGARRRDRGYRALSAGMIAVGAGDTRTARRAAEEARSLIGDEPLALLLAAQAAQLAGDGARARAEFEALSARPDTRILGLHGLFIEARRQGEQEAARHFAEAAAELSPQIAWAGAALFEYQAGAGDWLGALRTLSANANAKLIDKAAAQHLRAALLTARAMELEAGDPDEARAAALEAHRLEPELVPAAVTAGRLLTRAGDVRRAAKVLEAAWKAAPHPEIADAYASVRPGDSVRDRLKRMRRLAELRPNNPESAIAEARAAIDAHDFHAARTALAGLVRSGASERVCLLMAEIEGREHGDEGRVRTWLTRAITAPRDPAWVADGRAFEHWGPVSPVSGKVGAFRWAVPAEHAPRPAMVEIAPEPAAPSPRPPEPPLPQLVDHGRMAEPAEAITELEQEPLAARSAEPPPPAVAPAAVAMNPAPAIATPPAPAEPETPPPPDGAMPAPDDPGPEPTPDQPADEPRRRFWLF